MNNPLFFLFKMIHNSSLLKSQGNLYLIMGFLTGWCNLQNTDLRGGGGGGGHIMYV